MRRIAILLVAAVACRSVPVGAGPGASSPTAAVEQMLAAARAQDLQAISAVWGDEAGLVRDRWDRPELESRSFIMACILRSDSHVLGAPQPAAGGRVLVTADLKQGAASGSTRFETVRTKDGRWLVTSVDLPALQNKGFCTRRDL